MDIKAIIIIANRCNGHDRNAKEEDHFIVPTGKQVASWSQFKIVSASFIVASKRNV